jgi:hypothetical protein
MSTARQDIRVPTVRWSRNQLEIVETKTLAPDLADGLRNLPVDLNFQKTASVNNRGPLEVLWFYQSFLAPSQISNMLISDIGERNSIAWVKFIMRMP